MQRISLKVHLNFQGFPGGSEVKNLPAKQEMQVPSLALECPWEANGYLFQYGTYSSLENSMDRGTWQVAVHGVTKESDMT